ncbi:MAG TPA: carbonic anhydrase [Roseiflexaceae bacterium]|nr:carbonic anhydrase [Roseiflexaceae bacterium]HMP43159.1 carbonic anhydrase [Roseiflexaceae bacterium]
MSLFDDFLDANAEYARQFDQGELARTPRRQVAIVTCMDTRMVPEAFLGIQAGDANILRNAGGRVSDDVIRSLVISQRLLGTREIMVIHHTDCGLVTFTNADLAAKVRQDLGVDVGDFDFLEIDDLEQSVRTDVARLRNSPLIQAETRISGAIYNVFSGELREVVRA